MPLLPDLAPATLAELALVAFVAGLSRGFSGFGAALIFVPLASALAGPKLAAPMLLIVDGIFASPLIPAAWRLADRRDVSLMFFGAIAGVPIGAFALAHLAPLTLRWLIAGMAASMLALLLSGWRYRAIPHPGATIAVGAISGLFSGVAQIGGPPVMSYWLGTDTPLDRLRANVIVYFAASTALSLVSYFCGGLISLDILKIALFVGPAYGVGALGGARMFGLASPKVFRNSSLALIALAVAFSLPPFHRNS